MRGILHFRDFYIPKLRWRSLSILFLILTIGQFASAQVLNESFDNTSLPVGWTQEFESGTTLWKTVTTNGNSTITPHTGSRMAEFRVGSFGPTTKLVTPSLDLTGLANPQLTFYYANVQWAGDIDELRIYYKTSAAGSWEQIGDDYIDENTTWVKVELILPNPSSDYYIAFEATSNYARGLNLDDVLIDEAPSCITPTSLSVTTTHNSANLEWASDGTLFDIEWGATGFTPGTGTMINDTSDNPYNLTGLDSSTTYEFYVRNDCGGGDVSDWAGPYTFNTPPACGENFYDSGGNSSNYGDNENYSITIYPDVPGDLVSVSFSSFNTEQGWDGLMIYDGDSDSSPLVSSGSTYGRTTCPNGAWNGTGSYSANGMTFTSTHISGALTFVFTSDSGTNYVGWEASISCAPAPSCITPTGVSLETTTAYTAEFSWEAVDGAESYNWFVFENDADTESATPVASGNTTELTATATGLDADTDYDFYVQTDCGTTDGVSELSSKVDFSTEVSCVAPTTLTSTTTHNSATLGWTSDGDLFDIEWGPTGFAQGSGTMINDTSDNPYNLTGLDPSTTYEFYVRNDCGGDGASSWAGPYEFITACEAAAIPFFEGFENGFTHNTPIDGCWSQESILGTQTWNANNTFTDRYRTPRTGNWNVFLRYSNTDWLFYPVELEGGVNYVLEFYARQDGTTASNASVKASYGNSDTSAAMTNTIVGATGIINGDYQLISGIFTPATSGIYYIGINGTINGSPWYISIDDISLDLAPSCITPTGVSLETAAAYTAEFSWSAIDNAEGYNWFIFANDADPESATPVASGNTTELTVNATGLDPETDYDFYVQTDCGSEDGTSGLSSKVDFTTTVACPAPTEGTATSITTASAILSWTSIADTFDIEWGTAGFTPTGTPNIVGVGNNYLLDNGLTASTSYAFYVRAVCGGGDGESEWAGPYSFTTATPGQIGSGNNTSSNLPISSCFAYTYSQQIYLASEITGALDPGNTYITKIRFKSAILPSSMTNSNNWTVYMGNTDKASFADGSDWIAVGELEQVFSGILSFTAGGWVEIQLDNPFTWDGTSNVVVGVDENASSWNCTAEWATYDAGSNRAMANYTDGGNPDPASPPEANYGPSATIAQIQLVAIAPPSCITPTNLSHTQLSIISADLNWESDGNLFELKWGETGFDLETEGTLVDDLTETSYTLEGLTTDADYEFYVRTNCGVEDGVSTWAGPHNFSVGYCESVPTSNDYNGITNVTIDETSFPVSDVTYYNYNSSVVGLNAGESYPSSITFNTGTTYGYSYNVNIWVDFNDNGIFDNDSELIYIGESDNQTTTTLSFDLDIPFNSTVGEHKMRIGTADSGQSTPNPCYSGGYGVTIDLMVSISGAVTWTGSEWINGSPAEDVSVLVNGNLSIANDAPALEVNNMFISENGSITIESGNTLTVNGKITNDNSAASFVVENGGNLIQTNNDANSGAITVKSESQPMIRLDYTMWSSPVVGQNLFEFSPETVNGVNYEGSTCRIYVYDGTNGYVNTGFDENTTMNGGVGYLFRSPNNFDASVPEVYEGVFTGTPFNGDLSVATVADNYTSIGNPYPSNLDADALLAANSSDLSTLYLWVNTPLVDDEYTGTNYATYTNAGGTANMPGGTEPSGIIAVGQGFIVGTTGTSVDLNNSMRTDASTDFFKAADVERHRFWLNLFDGNNIGLNQILIAYMEGATSGFDSQIDGNMFGYEGSAIYSLIDEKAFTIQGRAVPFVDTDVVPLGFRAVESGKFLISLANFDGLFAEGQMIYIKDNLLGIQHKLNNSAYEFESEAGTFKDRFEIVYVEDGILGVDDLAANGVLIYKNLDFIEISSKVSPIDSVEIFDLQGRKIFSQDNINASKFQVNAKQFGTQVLVVNVTTENGVLSNKKMVNK